MPNGNRPETNATSNRAEHADNGEIREAHELHLLGYTDADRWVCVDENCRVRMIPCAWKPLNEDGEPYKRPPFFRAEPAHAHGCIAWRHDTRERFDPATAMPWASSYPNRVILSQTTRAASIRIEHEKIAVLGTRDRDTETHPTWTRSIRRACEVYVASVENHRLSLRVDGCRGATYGECFVRLGTGERKNVGRPWIFYDELQFRIWVDLDIEPLALTLWGTVSGVQRTLVVNTSKWLPGHQRDFRNRLKASLKEGRAAHKRGERDIRPWIFFYGREDVYDQTEFQTDLQPGVEVLACKMPCPRWDYRQSAGFPRQSGPLDGRHFPAEPPSFDAAGAAQKAETTRSSAVPMARGASQDAETKPPLREVSGPTDERTPEIPEASADVLSKVNESSSMRDTKSPVKAPFTSRVWRFVASLLRRQV